MRCSYTWYGFYFYESFSIWIWNRNWIFIKQTQFSRGVKEIERMSGMRSVIITTIADVHDQHDGTHEKQQPAAAYCWIMSRIYYSITALTLNYVAFIIIILFILPKTVKIVWPEPLCMYKIKCVKRRRVDFCPKAPKMWKTCAKQKLIDILNAIRLHLVILLFFLDFCFVLFA